MDVNLLYKKIQYQINQRIITRRIKTVKVNRPKTGINTTTNRKPLIIVSLTTYGKRLNTVYLCIKSILQQTLKPDKIILYLGTDVSTDMIPDSLWNLCKYGLEIITNCENLSSHKKYFFSMQKYPDDIIITVDDDLVYDKNLVKRLYQTYRRHPYSVICSRARIIKRDLNGALLPYDKWPLYTKRKATELFNLLPIGAGGVLYPPHILSKEAFNSDAVKKYCLNADDLWLRYMYAQKKVSVVCHLPFITMLAEIPESQNNALYKKNLEENKNDYYLKILEKFIKWPIDNGKDDSL